MINQVFFVLTATMLTVIVFIQVIVNWYGVYSDLLLTDMMLHS